ncbi:MAG TPA: TonB-dependent receptor, partial [Edaphobacter sp.]|nr:TonB-dependent receptor [Edaphobacter sp.]
MKTQVAYQRLTERWHTFGILVFLFVILLIAPVGLAQSGAGAIQGTITDITGAVIPDVSIKVWNTDTGVPSVAKTNSAGFYQVPGLFAGLYKITITATGMKTATTTLQLRVAQAGVVNMSLLPGEVTENVTVSADTVNQITTENGTISSTLENQRINQLPMNGRLLLTLAGETTPGLEGGGQRANGLMPEALEYVQDGAPLTNRNFGGETNSTQAQLPDPDAVQEVRIDTTNTSAQFSTPGTAIITTKSGTNHIRGTAFWTTRNNAIGIARARQNPSNFAAPHLVRNEFGVAVGGSLTIPRLYNGRDKTFWFFAYERFSLAASSYALQTVPTMAMRSGDFSGLVTGAGIPLQLYDPNTTAASTNCNGTGQANQYCRTPFSNNQIPLSRLSPAAKMLWSATPQPTTTDNPLVAPNLYRAYPQYQMIPTLSIRLDHTFNPNDKAYLRFTDNLQTSTNIASATIAPTLATDQLPQFASGYTSTPVSTFSAALGYTHIFSPTFFTETILSQQWESEYNVGGGNPSLNYESILGTPNNFSQPGFPTFSGLLNNYYTTQFNYSESQRISQIDENMTKLLGPHQLQFGGRYRYERFSYLPDRSADSVGFDNYATGLELPSSGTNYGVTPNTGFGDANFFLGAASFYSNYLQPPAVNFHDHDMALYLQDNYHVNRQLTLNLGFRYEAHPAPGINDGLSASIDLEKHVSVFPKPISYYVSKGYTTQAVVDNLIADGVSFEQPAAAGLPDALVRSYNFTFGPRFGIAWVPFQRKYTTVLRGGFGRYIYPVPTRNTVRAVVLNPPFQVQYFTNYNASNQSPDGLPNRMLRASPPSIMGANSSGVVNSNSTTAILPYFQVTTLSPNLAPDYVTQANMTVEQSLPYSSALRVSWVYDHGTNLDQFYHYDAAVSPFLYHMRYGTQVPTGSVIGQPTYAGTTRNPWDQTKYNDNILVQKDGWSNYNGLQVSYQRLYKAGVAFQATYVLSKAFRMGGNTFRDNYTYTAADYLSAGDTNATMTPYAGGVVTAPLPLPERPAGLPSYASWHGLNKYGGYFLD